MGSKNNYFIAVYTNSVKDYCDEQFFENLLKLKNKNYLGIVDNSTDPNYVKRLRKLAPTAAIRRIIVPEEPKISQFQRNVTESVNGLRDDFLSLNKDYFLTIESDVIPPIDLIEKLDKSIEQLNEIDKKIDDGIPQGVKKWGALGGIYYKGFHNFNVKTGIWPIHHVLSGCTVYKREAIEKYPFRYDPNNLGPFPDAWMSVDIGKDYTLWNDHGIICDHLHAPSGGRLSRPL